ncbi:MAG: transcription termination/antitermination protein NusA [Anaerolineales bacterium]|nr:transcription termination/antitermination protein NusA [Anaerolineales bacterium]
MKNEFALAFNEVLEEKGLPKEIVIEALQAALASAYRRHVNASNAQHVDAVIDPETGRVTIFAEKEIVEDVEDERTEVSLTDARQVDQDAALGEMVIVESTPNNFGRVAAQTARQVIQQRIREAEREAQFNHFSKQIGEIMSGVVQAVNSQTVTLGLEMKAEGQMPRAQQIPGERFRVHDRVRALLLEVKITPRGPQIILSRAHRNFLRRLLENEVPEIYHGLVEIRSIAREPGQRSKVAVAALQSGVDPVGACVGIRGVRIQAIVRELNDEKIDVIEWSSDPAVYIAKALSPARVSGVYLNEHAKGVKTATVVVPEDQLSLAIGRDGQNARLGAKLTAWKIDIKSLPEATSDALYKLQNDPDYASIAASEESNISLVEAILAKKSEGRPVTPEEYHLLTQFVDRVERGLIRQRETEIQAEEAEMLKARANVPARAFEVALEDFDISDRVYAVISETGLQTVGDLMLQMALDEDSIWKLSGMGPKAMQELKSAIETLQEQLRSEEAAVAIEAEPAGEIAPTEEAAIEPVEVEQPVGEAEPVEAEVAQPAEPEVEEALEAVIPEVESPPVEEIEPAREEGELEEEPGTLDEIFALRPEILEYSNAEEDLEQDDEGTSDAKKKKGKKKKKFVEVEYDPDKDVLLTKKKHKRDGSEWEEGW